MTAPYSDKKLLECKKNIMDGVDQIVRRSNILHDDWDEIRKLANIELPSTPFSNDKIIKLVGTNIFDFTTLVYDEIRVVDESTLLKFFINPVVEIISSDNSRALSTKKLLKNSKPTVLEFKKYLRNPITTSLYNDCIKPSFKEFTEFEDDYHYGIVDQILIANPYGKEIALAMKQNQDSNLNNKNNNKRKSKQINSRRNK